MNHLLKLSLALTATLVSLLTTGCDAADSKEPDAEFTKPVKIVSFNTQPDATPYQFIGEVTPKQTIPMSFRLGGEISHVHVEMGQYVREGELIAEIDPTDYQLVYQGRFAEFQLAQANHRRASHLYQQKLVSKEQFDKALTRFEMSQLELEQARTDLSYTQIRAPFDGIVSVRHVEPYQVIAPSEPIINLIDTSGYEVAISVPVATAHKLIGRELSLSFRLDSRPDLIFSAKRGEVSSQPDKDTNSYLVKTIIEPHEDAPLLPGQSGTVSVHLQGSQSDALGIPKQSWIEVKQQGNTLNGELWVFDSKTHRVSRRLVSVDRNTGTVSGLSNGEYIVESGVKDLIEGQKVRPWERERGI